MIIAKGHSFYQCVKEITRSETTFCLTPAQWKTLDATLGVGPGGTTGHSDLYGQQQQHSLQTQTWSQVADQILGLHMAFGGNTGQGHQHRLKLK